jgi:hypothetical protein
MDEQRIEAALRGAPPDEPTYEGDVADRLRAWTAASDEEQPPASVVELRDLAPRRRRSLLAISMAVAAAVVLVIALAVIARPQQPQLATTPTTIIPSPSSSITPASQFAEIVGRWVGATPTSVTTTDPSAPAFVVFSGDRVSLEHLSGGIVHDLNSQVTVTGVGKLRLTLTDQSGRCATGSIGEYRWTLSPQATTLTVVAVSDECATRGEALAGTWTHTACPARGGDCLGPLEAGRYASVHFDPFGSNSYGEVAYDVTDGWASTFDDKNRLTLLPPGGGESAVHGLYLFADIAPANADCSTTASTVPGSASEVAAALSAMPGLSVTTSEATVAAYHAQVLDLTSAATLSCAAERPLLASKPGSSTPWALVIGQGQRMRIVLIDLPGARTMAVVVASDRSATEYARLLEASTAVIDSFVLHAAP